MTRKLKTLIFVGPFVCTLIVIILIWTSSSSSPATVEISKLDVTTEDNTKDSSFMDLTTKIAGILKAEREHYLWGLKGYFEFTKEKLGFTSLTPETNGRPIQSCKLTINKIK